MPKRVQNLPYYISEAFAMADGGPFSWNNEKYNLPLIYLNAFICTKLILTLENRTFMYIN